MTVALMDELGQLTGFVLLPRQAHELKPLDSLIGGESLDVLTADKEYGTDWLLRKSVSGGPT